jgi:hypothetical protein
MQCDDGETRSQTARLTMKFEIIESISPKLKNQRSKIKNPSSKIKAQRSKFQDQSSKIRFRFEFLPGFGLL